MGNKQARVAPKLNFNTLTGEQLYTSFLLYDHVILDGAIINCLPQCDLLWQEMKLFLLGQSLYSKMGIRTQRVQQKISPGYYDIPNKREYLQVGTFLCLII